MRLRTERGEGSRIHLLVDGTTYRAIRTVRTDGLFDWYEAEIACSDEPISYCFLVEYRGRHLVCQKGGARWVDAEHPIDHDLDFRIVPGFHVPRWARGALQYQIFPDRFMNGNASNDVVEREYAYGDGHARFIADWEAPIEENDFRRFYGGDLQGIMSKLDYLQSLGVEAIYLNPIFVSPSSHKYDTQDYRHVDPHLAAIVENDLRYENVVTEGKPLAEGDLDNAHAILYIARTTSQKNLRLSNELFAELCADVHRRGMRIILDGVFNHCGSFSPWLDRERIYETSNRLRAGLPDGPTEASNPGKPATGAFRSQDSPYRDFFKFDDELECGYEAWWDFETLPKLNYEEASELCSEIIDIARQWASPPYSIDGWRLDVAADLGYDEEFNHRFWREFRQAVKDVNPDLLIVAEHYGDPAAWLQGDQWDTVMNYDAFMDPLTYFLTGMEKHSDRKRKDLYQDGKAFFDAMRANSARFSWQSLTCAMNELSNHDHSRFLTRTNRTVGRLETSGADAAAEGIDHRVLREAVVIQMTWPGAPTVYYGDEAGLVGWTDPDNRRTYPWGREDWGLIELHQVLGSLRRHHPALREGSLVELGCGVGWIAYARFTADDRVICACNNEDWEQIVYLRVRAAGIEDGATVFERLRTTKTGFTLEMLQTGTVRRGILRVQIPPRTALVLTT